MFITTGASCWLMGKGSGPPELDAIDMRGNIIKNGSFRQLKWWDEVHKSNTDDTYSITVRKNHVILERGKSEMDGGTVGLIQNLETNVGRYRALILSLDVCIEHHSLKDTGYWAKKHGGIGELPLVISLKYQDVNDGLQMWTIGFITRSHRIKDIGSQQNITLTREGIWSRHEFDLMNDGFRKDSSGNVLPKPKKVLQISVSGKGWDFSTAVGNMKLSSKRARERTKPHAPHPPQHSSRNTVQPQQSTSTSTSTQRSRSPSQKKEPRQQLQKKAPGRSRSAPPKEAPVKPRAPARKQNEPQKRGRQAAPPTPPMEQTTPPPPPSPPSPPQSQLPKSFKYDRVYVDASNVAHGVDLKKPLVTNIILTYNKLVEMGFQTVIIIADASLRHKIDDSRAFEDLINRGIVSQAPAKTSADEFLIGFAKQKTGYIITNDKLQEWRKSDPWAKKNLDDLSIQFMIQEDMVLFVGFPG